MLLNLQRCILLIIPGLFADQHLSENIEHFIHLQEKRGAPLCCTGTVVSESWVDFFSLSAAGYPRFGNRIRSTRSIAGYSSLLTGTMMFHSWNRISSGTPVQVTVSHLILQRCVL